MYRVAYRVTGESNSAEDVCQIVFLRLLEESRRIRHPERLASWLRRCAVNSSINLAKKRRRESQLEEILHRAADGRAARDDLSPEERLESEEAATRLKDALLRLPARERALLALRFDEDLTYEQIGAVVRRPVTTVKSQIRRAVARLRGYLNSAD